MALFTFTGANGDPIPAAITTQVGSWEIQNNKCVIDGTVAGRNIATVDSIANTSISVIYSPNGGAGNSGLTMNYVDADNYLMFIIGSSGETSLFETIGGVLNQITTGTLIPSYNHASGSYKISAIMRDQLITFQVDGVEMGSGTTALVSSTGKHGINSTDALHTFDELAVYTGELRIVGYGQSNMIATADNYQISNPSLNGTYATMFGADYVYKLLEDPTAGVPNRVDLVSEYNLKGSWLPRFSNQWFKHTDDGIAFLQCGRGARSIDDLSKLSTLREDGLNQYEAMIKRINAFGGCDVVFYQQGEGDCGPSSTSTYTTYSAALNLLADNIKADTGADTFIVPLHTITMAGFDGNGTTTGQAAIRQAQIDVAASNPNVTIGQPLTGIDISAGDGLHFKTDDQIDIVARRMYESYTQTTPNDLVLDYFDGAAGTDIADHTPNTDVVGGGWLQTAASVIELDGSGGLLWQSNTANCYIDTGAVNQVIDLKWNAGGVDNRFSLYGRSDGTTDNGYQLNILTGAVAAKVILRKLISGVSTELYNELYSFVSDQIYDFRLIINDSSLELLIDGENVTSIADTDITTGTYALLKHELHTNSDGRVTYFNVNDAQPPITSTLNITFSGSSIPNATYDVDFYNDTTKELIETRSIVFTDSTLSEELPVAVATNIFGKVDGDNMPTNGAPFYGVTE